jgi:nucleoside-diphosphate-sugar epimerase
MSLTCAVTGANGYVGGVIAAALRRRGCNVVELGRKPSAAADPGGYRRFSLGDPIDPLTLSGLDALVHCAYDFAPIDPAGIAQSNVEGTLALFRAARAAGVKQIIFISSMSAFEGCKSLYGQAKLSVEKNRDELGLIIVRPGLVYGSGARGMVGSLAKLASLPLLTPLVGLGNMVLYLAHEQDLGGLIDKLLDPLLPPPPTPIIAANDSPRTLRQIISILGASQGKGKKLFVPIPSTALWAMLKTAEAVGLRPRTRSDSLVSLMNQDPHPDFAGLHRLGVPFREFEASALAPGGGEAKPR